MGRLPRKKPSKGRLGVGPKHKLVYRKHEQWIRGHICCVQRCHALDIVTAHVRAGYPAGTPNWEKGGEGLKPHSKWTIPLCDSHHMEQHQAGWANEEDSRCLIYEELSRLETKHFVEGRP